MSDILNTTAVTLQENILLNHAEILQMRQLIQDVKRANWWVPCFIAILLVGVNLLAGIPFDKEMIWILTAMYLFTFILFRFSTYITMRNYKKDMRNGKSILTSTLVSRVYNKYGSLFIFEGPYKGKRIRIGVKRTDYKRYSKGARLRVIFLPSSKVALNIIEVQ